MKYLFLSFSCLLFLFSCEDSNSVSPSGTGQGGSMARFATVGDYLYVVDSRVLHTYDISNSADPVKIKDIELGVNIETIFPYQEKLFIGSQDGMHIYDISVPEEPVFLSTYWHVTSCDPVVVQDNLAYVTLRTDNSCTRGVNRLEIIDISNPLSPQMVSSFEMENPFGLGIDDTTLFVCEGNKGLKVLNVADPYDIKTIGSFEDLHAFDVIPFHKNLILTGRTGVFQFDYSDLEKLKLHSKMLISSCP